MIGVFAALACGLIAGLKTPLLSPVIYLSRFRKDIFIAFFFFYSLALGYEFVMKSVYDADLMSLAVILSSFLLLDAGLRDESMDFVGYFLIVIIIIGFFLDVFVFALLIAFFYHFSKDNPRRGIFIVSASIFLLILGLVFCKGMLNLLGASSTQVVFISAISILIFLIKEYLAH
ncbi:MAG TPA: hypothetical protein EYP30_00060 [Archaeoglobaceae archaeon]|nr:hypothetical protein [Archaeoglobaceae archaeon]